VSHVEHAHQLVPVFSPDVFRGTAEFYSRFRPRYPAVLLATIERMVRLGPDVPLLDLACGTGDVALNFVDLIVDIWAIDLEPEMVETGRRLAQERGVERIRWLTGRAEDADLPEGHFGIVTVGRAFHRLNRPLIAQRALRWLRPGGSFIDMGAGYSGLFEPDEPWLAAAGEVYERWLPRAHKSQADVSSSAAPDQPKATTQTILTDAGFADVAKHEFVVPYVREIDQYIGYLMSTSYSSREFWGDAWAGFEADMRETLMKAAPTGVLIGNISAYFVTGRRP
jgi:ubiquinone/menaquinone biosynthesis C-methylase UbiE